MTTQEYIDSIYTSNAIKTHLTEHAKCSNNLTALRLVTELPRTVVRAEFYLNVNAEFALSVRQTFVGGAVHDGPVYGYALALGLKPEHLHRVIKEFQAIGHSTFLTLIFKDTEKQLESVACSA